MPDIGEYGFLSDCQSAALVSRHGSVDWWCVPRFDSPSVFGRLLGPEAGHWSLHPAAPHQVHRAYLPDSLVLRTVFSTGDGEVAVTDALATEPGARGHQLGLRSPHVLIRTVEGLRGSVELVTDFAPRMEYGLTVPHLALRPDGVQARGGPVTLTLTTPVRLDYGPDREPGRATARFRVQAGERIDFRLAHQPAAPSQAPAPQALLPTVEDTTSAWRSLAAMHHTYDGPYRDAVRHSALVLQGLTYQPSGTVLAAATTSVPEHPGATDDDGGAGDPLTFDYRFAWLRDLSLTVRALWVAACPDEADRLFGWISDAAGHLDGRHIQIMYGAEGERDLNEHGLEHLPGFGGRGPVRVGNAAWRQEQRDVPGEVLDAAHQLRDQLGVPDPAVRELLVALADPGRRHLGRSGRGHVGGPRPASALPLVQAHVLGRAGPGRGPGPAARPGGQAGELGPDPRAHPGRDPGPGLERPGQGLHRRRCANDLGLLAEGGDPATGARRGNYPQAFSHVGLITAAWRLGQCS